MRLEVIETGREILPSKSCSMLENSGRPAL